MNITEVRHTFVKAPRSAESRRGAARAAQAAAVHSGHCTLKFPFHCTQASLLLL